MNQAELQLFLETLNNTSPITLSSDKSSKMADFCSLLLEKNKVMNLTAVKDPESAAILHFADSLYPLTAGELGESILDVGAGGGFPSVPLAIAGDFKVTSLDSTAKKLDFIADCAKSLDIPNLSTLCGRAEELSRAPEYREAFDTVVSRGVARLNILLEWCLPFVKAGGKFIAMKGSKGGEELSEAQNAIKVLGGSLSRVISYTLPGDNREYNLIIIEKISKTPDIYPRHNNKIERKPL